MNKRFDFPLAAMAAALLAAFGPACAQQNDELDWLTKPSSTVAVGIGYLNKDAPQFGRYTGIRDEGIYGLLSVDLNKLNESTGTWIKFKGNNLGLENRDMRFSWERQGDWGYYVDYSQTPRFEPYTANTAVQGIGSGNLIIPTTKATNLTPTDLKLKREAVGVGFTKQMSGGFDLVVRVRNEDKDGARIFGRGTGTNAFEFTPEPVHSTTRQVEAILGYSGSQLQMSGIYYGTTYDNHNPALMMTGGGPLFNGTPPFNSISLPPDSQSHQLAIDGGYSFTPTTRGSFKLSYSRATQNDTFISGVPVAPGIAANGNLGGQVDTVLAQLGLSARPTSKLSVVADLRYEDRDDKTPVRAYAVSPVVTGLSTYNGENQPISVRTTAGRLEATYQLPAAFRVTSGIDYDVKERNTTAIRSVSFRDRTEETSYRIALKRAMSESVTGSIAYIRSERNGSDFLNNVLNGGGAGANFIAPLNLADRERDKVRLSLSWAPTNDFSLQLMADQTRDDYASRTAADYGLRDGSSQNYSVDASYAFADEWQATAWVSKNDTVANRATRISATNPWSSKLENNSNSVGFGLRGKLRAKWDVGADLSYSDISDKYQQQAISGSAVSSLPEVFTRLANLKLFATYALRENASVRFDYIYDRYTTNDWTWSSWNYSDGTYLAQPPRQYVSFFGITYIYRFQ